MNLMKGQQFLKIRPLELFLYNILPMKTAVNSSKFCLLKFMHGPFIKILPQQTFVPYGIRYCT